MKHRFHGRFWLGLSVGMIVALVVIAGAEGNRALAEDDYSNADSYPNSTPPPPADTYNNQNYNNDPSQYSAPPPDAGGYTPPPPDSYSNGGD
ncbi:MAG: hypothetical protein AB7P04_16195 [Bacteriovoracia bacterium]